MKTRDDIAIQERPALVAASTTSSRSALGTILFHVHDDAGLDLRLEAALSLARAASAHLECLHVTPIQAYTVTDTFGGVFTSGAILQTLEAEAAKLRARLERKLAAEDVSWSYREITGELTGQLVAHAALADLLVAARGAQGFEFAGSSIGFLGDLLSDSRTPILVLSDSLQNFDPEGPALVAWNGSYEAANAVRASVGMLNSRLRAYAARRSIPYADYWSALATPDGGMKPQYSEDGVHLNAAGYEAIRPIAQAAIARAMGSSPSHAGPAAIPNDSPRTFASITTPPSSPAAGSKCPTIFASAWESRRTCSKKDW